MCKILLLYKYVLVGLNLAIDLERIPNHEKNSSISQICPLWCGLSVICQFFPMTGCKTCGSAEWFKNGNLLPLVMDFYNDT